MLSGEPRNREELLVELREAQTNGLLSPDTYAMVEGALRVAHLLVEDVLVPRAQMVMLPIDDEPAEIIATVIESGHSRFPVHGEDKDEVVGILLAKDLLPGCAGGNTPDIRSLLRPPVLVPESMRLNVLLAELRRSRNHMAVVVDEYGGVAGLITIEDILEEIVGEIDDEHDDAVPPRTIVPGGESEWLVDAITTIEEFNEQLGSQYSDEEYDTIGGMVTAEIGHLPEPGEEATLDDFAFSVTRADDRRVLQFRVRNAPSK